MYHNQYPLYQITIMPVRVFTIKGIGGKYIGRTPLQAAYKAFRKIGRSGEAVRFTIKEVTKGSENEEWIFEGSRKEVDPFTVKMGDKMIEMKHKSEISRIYNEPLVTDEFLKELDQLLIDRTRILQINQPKKVSQIVI